MALNVFVSKLSNTDHKIKNSLSQRSSLGMGAYIFREVFVANRSTHVYKVFDRKKTADDILFKGVIIPSKIPIQDLNRITNKKASEVKRLKDVFKNVPDHAPWKYHLFLDDNETVVKLLEESDRHIAELERIQYGDNQRIRKLRLYNAYVISLPTAQLHFPKSMGLTREDLYPIMYSVVLDLIHNHFTQNGQICLFGFHLAKEDGMVHVHLLVPERTLKYHYQFSPKTFNERHFLIWLQKDKISRAKESVEKNLAKFKDYKTKFDANPTEENHQKMMNFSERYDKAKMRRDAISQILNFEIKSGPVYEMFKEEFMAPKKSRNKLNSQDDSYFSDQKGYVEKFQETYEFLDSIKRNYADLLNRYLIENGLIKNNNKLFTYVPAGPNYITNHEMRLWNISFEQLQKVNRKIKEIFNADKSFFYQKEKSHPYMDKKKRKLIVHTYKHELKTEFNLIKKDLALNYEKAEVWVDGWLQRLDHLRTNFRAFLMSLIDPNIFNVTWRKQVRTKLVLLWQEIKQEIATPEGYEVVDVNFDVDEPKGMSVDEIIQAQQEVNDSDEGSTIELEKQAIKPSVVTESSPKIFPAQPTKPQTTPQAIQSPVEKTNQTSPVSEKPQKAVECEHVPNPWELENHDAFIKMVFGMSQDEIDRHLASISDSDLEKEFIFFAKDIEIRVSGSFEKGDRLYLLIIDGYEYYYDTDGIKGMLWNCYEKEYLVDEWLQKNAEYLSL